jgi:hypothetical protein
MVSDDVSADRGRQGATTRPEEGAAMYIGVMHTITDKAMWATKLAEFQKTAPPDGYSNPFTVIGAQTDYAFCLWEAPSMEELQPMLDQLTEGGATNAYFRVDPTAMGTAGIPGQRIDLESKAPAKA